MLNKLKPNIIMKNFLYFLVLLSTTIMQVNAQNTAKDWETTDCEGNPHHFFEEMDNNKVLLVEFFMLNCGSCQAAGKKLQLLYNNLKASYPNNIAFYQVGFDNSYTCNQITSWKNTNNYTSQTFAGGSDQVNYYGGMGMPTIVAIGGAEHNVLYKKIGFTTSDTTTIGKAIREQIQSFEPLGITQKEALTVNVYPNPLQNNLNISIPTKTNLPIQVTLYNTLGEQLINQQFNAQTELQIPLQKITSGIYMLQVKQGNSVYSQKVIKK